MTGQIFEIEIYYKTNKQQQDKKVKRKKQKEKTKIHYKPCFIRNEMSVGHLKRHVSRCFEYNEF